MSIRNGQPMLLFSINIIFNDNFKNYFYIVAIQNYISFPNHIFTVVKTDMIKCVNAF